MESAYNRCLGLSCQDEFLRQKRMMRHLDMQNIKIFSSYKLAQLRPACPKRNRTVIAIEPNLDTAAQTVQVSNIPTFGLANQVVHIMALTAQPFANCQYVLLDAVR